MNRKMVVVCTMFLMACTLMTVSVHAAVEMDQIMLKKGKQSAVSKTLIVPSTEEYDGGAVASLITNDKVSKEDLSYTMYRDNEVITTGRVQPGKQASVSKMTIVSPDFWSEIGEEMRAQYTSPGAFRVELKCSKGTCSGSAMLCVADNSISK